MSFALANSKRRDGAQRSRTAFTLIELLVVVAIIALLISILLPSLSRAREISRRTVCGTQVRSYYQTLVTYATEHNGVYPDPGNMTGAWDNTPLRMPEYVAEGKARGFVAPDNTNNSAFTDAQYVHPAMREYLHLNLQMPRKFFYCPSAPQNNLDQHWFEGAPSQRDGGHIVTGYIFFVGRPEFANKYDKFSKFSSTPPQKAGEAPRRKRIRKISGLEEQARSRFVMFPRKTSNVAAFREAVMDFTRAANPTADFSASRVSNHIVSKNAIDKPGGPGGLMFMPESARGGANVGYADGSVRWKTQCQMGQNYQGRRGRVVLSGYRWLVYGTKAKFWW